MEKCNKHDLVIFLSVFFVCWGFTQTDCRALEPNEVLVVANRNAAKSMGLAEYYMKKRGIPEGNFITLWVTDKEYCSYEAYMEKIYRPIRRYLKEKDKDGDIRCILLMYGIPLKIIASPPTEKEQNGINALKNKKSEFEKRLATGKDNDAHTAEQIEKRIHEIDRQLRQTGNHKNRGASVDSEIALVMAREYSLTGWIPNPYYIGRPEETLAVDKSDVLMVSRLDGPTDKIVRRIVDETVSAEKEGLQGVCYLDARWPAPAEDKKLSGYALYDRSIHRTSDFIIKKNLMPTVIEATQRLFLPGECPEAALYCGWYSLARYVDAFQWQRGAVGYHIASSECTTLKGGKSRVWCKRMLEEGVAVTIGPVGEPYVQAFPVPEIFFRYLLDGYLTLAECYFISLPYLSWKMVLVGDPLYRPFNRQQ